MKNYKLIEGADPINAVNSILIEHKSRPLKKFLLFLTKGYSLDILNKISKELPDCEFAGGTVYGIGDYNKQFHHNGVLLIRLDDQATIKFGIPESFQKDTIIFSSTHSKGINDIVKVGRNSNVPIFGSNLINIFFNNIVLSSEEILQIETRIFETKTSIAWNKTIETPTFYNYDLELTSRELAQEFLDCAYDHAERNSNALIITCQNRVENILFKDFNYLEDSKTEYFLNKEIEGFGFAGEGIYDGNGESFTHRTCGLGFASLKDNIYEDIK